MDNHLYQTATKTITVHESQVQDGRKLYLIDTPGFDDTFTSDVEILRQISLAFANLYKAGGRLRGMIYLHRITDPRMGGSAITNLEVFKRLCGPKAMPMVRLVTTRWETLEEGSPLCETAQQHEKQLTSSDKFWAPLVKDGAEVFRHWGGRASAMNILKSIMQMAPSEPLAIQVELVHLGLEVAMTQAGIVVEEQQKRLELQHQREVEELKGEIVEALKAKDEQLSRELAEELEAQQKKHKALEGPLTVTARHLHQNLDTLNREMIATAKRALTDSGSVNSDSETRVKQMNARIDLLASNLAELQDELDRKERLHAAQLNKFQRQAREAGKQQESHIAQQAAEIAARHDAERQESLRTIEDYKREQRHLQRARRQRNNNPWHSFLSFFAT